MKDVTFGQYYPADSFVHRLDPRIKFFFFVVYVVALFMASNFYGLAVCAAALLAIIACARIPFGKVLRSIRGILVLLLFTAILNVLFVDGETVYAQWWIFAITKEGLLFAALLSLRLVLLVLCSSMLTFTTTPVALTDGVENLLTPLKWIRVPVHSLALVMSIALRMIPVLMDEVDRIKNAQRARGADLDRGGLIKKIKTTIPVLVPLVLSALRRADELGEAMDARCYMGDKHRTKYKKLRFGWRDLIAFLAGAALVTGIVLMSNYLPSPM